MSFRTSLRASLPYAATIVSGFLVAYLFVAFAIFPSGVVPGNAKVPNVMGLLYPDAVKRLGAVGFQATRGDRIYRDATPVNTVLGQDPPAGTKEPEGTIVTLTVSSASVTDSTR